MRPVQALHDTIFALHRNLENLNYNLNSNGERAILRAIARTRCVSTVLDVGANQGDWTRAARDAFPDARIHSFEILDNVANGTQERFRNDPLVTVNSFGLSDADATIDVYFDPGRQPLATAVKGFSETFHGIVPATTSRSVITGDHYCEDNDIQSIDFLKIDVEGYEPKVLKGFEGMLRDGRIDIIQFEYGYVSIDTHFLLKDFYAYLTPFSMVLGKIYPTYVDFHEYRYVDENFIGPNYFAVRSDRTDLLDALKSY